MKNIGNKEVAFGKLHEECGVFGIFDNDNHDVARLTYHGLYALQHRGQESAGIAVNDQGRIIFHKDLGLASDVFDEVVLNHLKGCMAVGHVRYSKDGEGMRENSQPMVVKYRSGQIALAHNGSLINANELRNQMEEFGAIFQTTSDTEVMANLISRNRTNEEKIEDSIQHMMCEIKGSYALIIMTSKRLIGIRDPLGIRPLCMGKLENSYILASESCAIDALGGEFIRDIKPGEIVIIDEYGVKSIQTETPGPSRLCIFEFVYFARPDSNIDGVSVHEARIRAGRQLAIEHPVDADLVIGAPDGALNAALGYSRQSGIAYGQGLLKNRYVGRTFIQPEQGRRETSVQIKFNAMKNEVNGKRIILVDDSIVRGTTTKRIVQILKNAGATEVHMRISSPPYRYPCYFGIDISSSEQLVASRYTVEEICEMIGADSLAYLSLEGLLNIAGTESDTNEKCQYCTACFTGEYPMEVPEDGANEL
jgi:amidophosphoribosyltransferase